MANNNGTSDIEVAGAETEQDVTEGHTAGWLQAQYWTSEADSDEILSEMVVVAEQIAQLYQYGLCYNRDYY